ncbi:aldehyde dehydrogenase, partial [Gammaproteobacteria bacterium SCGC AG-212-F23]
MDILKTLQLKSKNPGACAGHDAWFASKDAGEFISYNPTNQTPIASVYNASFENYEYIIKQAQKTFLHWRTVPAPKRSEIIREIGIILRENKKYLGSLVSLETGKSKQEGEGEVQEMIDMADFAVGQSRMLYGNTMHSERPDHRMYEQWHPLGVVGIMPAFNFPVAIWAWNAFLAIITGNTVIWKPSAKAPLCAIAVQHICNAVTKKHELSGLFSLLISSEHLLGERMANDKRISLISFTGSSTVGAKIAEAVAKRFGKSLLELSGNNAIIIDETADLKLAIPSVVFSAVGTAGQRCTSIRRLLIHESIYEKCMNSLKKSYQKITIGDPLDPKNLMGPLIDRSAVEEFAKAIVEIKQAGGKILFGGKVLARAGHFVQPTLVVAENHWDIVQRETFAPILYLIPFKKFEDAIAMQNHSSYGLSSALFTNSLKNAELFLSARGSDCGIANINIGTSGAEIGGAFGGEKQTGGGREAGSDAWKVYMRRQTNTINWS